MSKNPTPSPAHLAAQIESVAATVQAAAETALTFTARQWPERLRRSDRLRAIAGKLRAVALNVRHDHGLPLEPAQLPKQTQPPAIAGQWGV